MLTPARGASTEGAVTVLVVGFVSIALALIVAGIDASKVFLARRALSAAADAAVLAAAQAADRDAIYHGGGGCGGLLPVDEARASRYAEESVADAADGLRGTVARVDPPVTSVRDGVVTVRLQGAVAVPFGRVLSLLVPGHAHGQVEVGVVAHAQSRLTSPQGC